MFFSENLDQLYTDLTNKNVTVGEMVTMPSGKVFNFADSEGIILRLWRRTNNNIAM